MFVLIEVGVEGNQEYWEVTNVLCAKETRAECVDHMNGSYISWWKEDYGTEESPPALVESGEGNFTYPDEDGDLSTNHGYQIREV